MYTILSSKSCKINTYVTFIFREASTFYIQKWKEKVIPPMKKTNYVNILLALSLTLSIVPSVALSENTIRSDRPETTVLKYVPTEKEIQVPPGLTEPFFVPFAGSSPNDPYYKEFKQVWFPHFALVSPTGKVIDQQEALLYPGYISPLQDGYGFFHIITHFGNSSFIIFDQQGNTQELTTYNDYFTQIDGEWFLYSPTSYTSYLYNARTKISKQITDEELFPISSEHTGEKTFDIHHYPFVKRNVKDGMVLSYKFGLKDMSGKIHAKPFFDEYMGYSEGLHRVKINGMTHFITHEGKVVLKPSRNYKVESNIHSGVFIISGKKDNEEFYLLMNKKGTFASKKYAFLKETSDGQFIAVSKTKNGHFFQKINAMDKPTTTLPYKLDKPEQLKQLKQTGKLFHTDTQIIADVANKQPFPFPHKLLTPPRKETVSMEYTVGGKKYIGTFTHDGTKIYARELK